MLQGSLFTAGAIEVNAGVLPERIWLGHAGQPAAHDNGQGAGPASWVDVFRSLLSGGDDVFESLRSQTQWRTGRRVMFDREVDDPRLMCWYPAGTADPHPALTDTRRFIEYHYAALEPSASRSFKVGGVSLNYYRDGNDSVAYHGDKEMRQVNNTIVAVLTTGAQRPFRVRPLGGGNSIDLSPSSGDLIVMGGRCQADFEHAVPKVGRAIGPRISASWRWAAHTDREGDFRHTYFTSRKWRPA